MQIRKRGNRIQLLRRHTGEGNVTHESIGSLSISMNLSTLKMNTGFTLTKREEGQLEEYLERKKTKQAALVIDNSPIDKVLLSLAEVQLSLQTSRPDFEKVLELRLALVDLKHAFRDANIPFDLKGLLGNRYV